MGANNLFPTQHCENCIDSDRLSLWQSGINRTQVTKALWEGACRNRHQNYEGRMAKENREAKRVQGQRYLFTVDDRGHIVIKPSCLWSLLSFWLFPKTDFEVVTHNTLQLLTRSCQFRILLIYLKFYNKWACYIGFIFSCLFSVLERSSYYLMLRKRGNLSWPLDKEPEEKKWWGVLET
jgi:hypothetical protein